MMDAPDNRFPPLSWWAGPAGLVVYLDGVEISTIPPSRFVHLMHDITRSMMVEQSGHHIEQSGAGNGK